jgi:phosphoesterase RecJ-like protein
MIEIDAILDLISKNHSFLVASHAHPDGDAIASTLGLTCFLDQIGKKAVAFNVDGIPDELAFLPGAAQLISDPGKLGTFDVCFVLDSGDLSRAGEVLRSLCAKLVNIDHHPYSDPFGCINYVDEQACATGALIYRIVERSGQSISKDLALCLYTAILSDTGSFHYSNANPEAFRIASSLVQAGVSPWHVAGNLYESRPIAQIKLLSSALETLTISPCGRFGAVFVTADMLSAAGAGPEDTDGLINYPRSIRGIEVALFFRQVGNEVFKVSFRSKGKVDVGSLARELGGGGHHNAAGATLSGGMDQVRQHVLKRLNELLPFPE